MNPLIIYFAEVYLPDRDSWLNLGIATTWHAAVTLTEKALFEEDTLCRIRSEYRPWYFDRWDVRN